MYAAREAGSHGAERGASHGGPAGGPPEPPKLSEEWLRDSFCRNVGLVTEGDPEKLRHLTDQMRKLLDSVETQERNNRT
jgi:hypothetical protein